MPLGVPYQPCVAVDGRHRLAEAEFNTVFNKEIPGRQRQRLGAASGKILGEVYPVVGGVTLFAKHHDSILLMQIAAHALFEKWWPTMPCPTSTNTGFVIVIIPAACGCVEEGSKSQSTVAGSSLSRRAVSAAAAVQSPISSTPRRRPSRSSRRR